MNHIFTLSSGEEIPVIIYVRRGLHNITIRPKTSPRREIHISRPWSATISGALKFLEQKRKWVENVFVRAPIKTKIKDGDSIEFLCRRVQIKHVVGNYAPRWDGAGANILLVGGAPEHLERRVRDFIKSELLAEIKKIIRENWPKINDGSGAQIKPKRIALRDTTSRWGSCSTTGTLSFSWRLAFASPEILRYIVLHELAHCRHMNHSPEFWATVAALYGPGVARVKRWLTQNGGELHRYF